MNVKIVEEIIKDGNSFIKKYSIIYDRPIDITSGGQTNFNKDSFYKRLN